MREGISRNHATTRTALHKTLLQQERLDNFLDGVPRFAKGRRDGFDPHRTTAKTFRNQFEIAPAEGGLTAAIDFQCSVGRRPGLSR